MKPVNAITLNSSIPALKSDRQKTGVGKALGRKTSAASGQSTSANTARSGIVSDELLNQNSREVFSKSKMLVNHQKVSALQQAEKAWKAKTPFLVASRPSEEGCGVSSLSDGQKVVKDYGDWASAKYFESGEAFSPRFNDPTVFYIAASPDAPLLRLGTVAELEDKGLGCTATRMLIDQEGWAEREGWARNKVLLSVLDRQNFFSSESEIRSRFYTDGLSEESVHNAALRALFFAAADTLDDGHQPLIKALLAHGIDPHEGKEHIGDTPYEIAQLNENAAAIALFDEFKLKVSR